MHASVCCPLIDIFAAAVLDRQHCSADRIALVVDFVDFHLNFDSLDRQLGHAVFIVADQDKIRSVSVRLTVEILGCGWSGNSHFKRGFTCFIRRNGSSGVGRKRNRLWQFSSSHFRFGSDWIIFIAFYSAYVHISDCKNNRCGNIIEWAGPSPVI